MRIALVADTFSVLEGTGIARYAEELRAGLVKIGLTVEPIAPQAPGVPFGQALNHALRMPYLVRSKARDCSIVHAASPITALAFPCVRKPRVVTYLDLVSLLCHETSSSVHARLFAPFFLRIGKFADRIIAVSSQTKCDLIQHLGFPAEKIAVVNLGIADTFQPRPRMSTGKRVIGYVGTLNRRKGLAYLIKAIHILGDAHADLAAKLVICGNRNLQYPRLARSVSDLGLTEVVEFQGFIPDDQLVDVYNSVDVLVLPSEQEGFGLPILEAQRCGVPVIIRADAHIPEEVSACCLKARSQEHMAEQIYQLLTNDDLRQHLATQGLAYSQQFTWERTVQQTVQVYRDLVPAG